MLCGCLFTFATVLVQVASCDSLWNLRGILNNCWHKVNIQVDPEEESDE